MLPTAPVQGNWKKWVALDWQASLPWEGALNDLFSGDQLSCAECGISVSTKSDDEEKEEQHPPARYSFFQVAPANLDYREFDTSWRIICPFCHISRFMAYAVEEDFATLIYAPWITQRELTSLWVCSSVVSDDGTHLHRRESKDILQALEMLAFKMISILPIIENMPVRDGEEVSDITRIKRLVRAWGKVDVCDDKTVKLFEGIRVIPLRRRFEPVLLALSTRMIELNRPGNWVNLVGSPSS